MALTKIKLDEVDAKATPVLADSVLISDSEDDGRGKLVTGTALKNAMATNLVTTDGAQTITGIKHFDSSGTGTEGFIFDRYSIRTVRPNTTIRPNVTGIYDLTFGNATYPYANIWFTTVGAVRIPTVAPGANDNRAASTEFVQTAIDNAIYDLPVTRSGLVSAGTDSIIFETSNALSPEWYDTTHVLNVSFFARNDSGINNNTTFKLQLYNDGTSTAHTIASITADTMDYRLLQASIYRASSSSVNCNIQYGYVSGSGYVSLAAGSYKLRVVCTSTLSTVFGAAQVRFTK